MENNSIINSVRSCDTILVSGKSLISKLIKCFTGCNITHVAFIYRIYDKELDFKIPVVFEVTNDDGAHIITLETFLLKTKGRMIFKRHKNFEFLDKKAMINTAFKYSYVDYDFEQIIKLLFRKGYNADNKMICSQLLDVIFKASNVQLNSYNGVVTPKSINEDTNFNIISI